VSPGGQRGGVSKGKSDLLAYRSDRSFSEEAGAERKKRANVPISKKRGERGGTFAGIRDEGAAARSGKGSTSLITRKAEAKTSLFLEGSSRRWSERARRKEAWCPWPAEEERKEGGLVGKGEKKRKGGDIWSPTLYAEIKREDDTLHKDPWWDRGCKKMGKHQRSETSIYQKDGRAGASIAST